MEKIGMLRLDLYIAVILFAIPMGWSVSGFAPNIVFACVCWGLSFILLAHAFWIYEKTAGINRLVKALVVVASAAILACAGWHPVLAEYSHEHYVVDSPSLYPY